MVYRNRAVTAPIISAGRFWPWSPLGIERQRNEWERTQDSGSDHPRHRLSALPLRKALSGKDAQNGYDGKGDINGQRHAILLVA
jgi:hypothetical protein